MSTCTTCDLGLEHCHAPLLEFADGTYECTAGCGGPLVVHDDIIRADRDLEAREPFPLVPAA